MSTVTSSESSAVGVSKSITVTWSGPVPSPDTIEYYNRVVPGAGERILAMAEEESRVRRETMLRDHETENRVKESDILLYHKSVFYGQTLAAIVLLAIVAAIIVCAVCGHGGAAAAVAGMGAAGIVSNFIIRREKNGIMSRTEKTI